MGIISDDALVGAAIHAVTQCMKPASNRRQIQSRSPTRSPGHGTSRELAGTAIVERDVKKIANSLRQERRLGASGHWSYDLNRHLALAQALAKAQSLARAQPAGKQQSRQRSNKNTQCEP